jgi:hypothetical protein
MEPPSTGKKNGFYVARGELLAPGTIRLIRCIRRIRVPTLNLDASPMARCAQNDP